MICPLCQVVSCRHEKAFLKLGIAKLLLIQQSLCRTTSLFSRLINFLPFNKEIQYKISYTYEDLNKCMIRMNEIQQWCENQLGKDKL